jgi:hypothetical protein
MRRDGQTKSFKLFTDAGQLTDRLVQELTLTLIKLHPLNRRREIAIAAALVVL